MRTQLVQVMSDKESLVAEAKRYKVRKKVERGSKGGGRTGKWVSM